MAHGPDSTPGVPGEVVPGTRRGTEGFFHLAQHRNGQWGLYDPDGRLCFVRAVRGVRNEPSDTDRAPGHAAIVRLREWEFNAVGIGGDGVGRDDGLPFLALVDFCRATSVIAAPGVRLPDVFNPDWPAHAAAHASLTCAPLTSNRELIGWVSDDDLAWGNPPAAGTPGLLQVCLSLEPAFPAYHAAWEFLLALHGGKFDSVARAWGLALANKEVLRDMTRNEAGIATRGYLRDEARWAREFARRYFTSTSAAIRGADPHHLVCGCRLPPNPPGVTAGAQYPAVDLPLVPWTDLPAVAGRTGPLIACDVGWADPAFLAGVAPAGGRAPRLTTIERTLRRARAALRRLARHPAVIGYVWRRWRDDPGEQPPFAGGLVHIGGIEARENTEMIADFNARSESLRRAAAKQLSP